MVGGFTSEGESAGCLGDLQQSRCPNPGVLGTPQTPEDEGSSSQGYEAVAPLARSVNLHKSPHLSSAEIQRLKATLFHCLYQPGSHLRPAWFGSKL